MQKGKKRFLKTFTEVLCTVDYAEDINMKLLQFQSLNI